jgi:transcriptional regulator with XRE-family HTH domain
VLDIGLEIRILRERLKISAKDLAEKVGLSQSQMSRLEKGQRRIDTQVLRQIAEALEVAPSYFFRGASIPNQAVLPALLPQALGKVIRSERRKRHISAEELASKVGRTKAAIQTVEEGRVPLEPALAESILKVLRLPSSVLLGAQEQVIRTLEAQVARLNEALAEAHRADLELVDGAESPSVSGGLKRRGTPVLGTRADGYPQEFDSAGRPAREAEEFLFIPELDPVDGFALYAQGDSMEASSTESFREGDLLILAPLPLRSRDFAFVRLRNAPATFRQVFFEPKARVRLQPLNLNYPATFVPRSDVLFTWRLAGHVRGLA